MVSEGLKAEAKSPNRKVTFADSVEERKFQPFSDAASMVSEDLKDEVLDSENETESACEPATNEPDCVNLDPSFKLSPTPPPFSLTSTIIAPLDADPLISPYDPKADPLIPPYDPKVNYLSPRPQFLRYRPNPRLQLYKERGCMKLDDGFSDTELTEEALSGVSEKESEVSSDEIVSEEQSHVSEASTINSTLMLEQEIAEAKGVAKPGFSMRSKAIALLLLLSVACFSISFTNPQVFDPVSKELTILAQTCDSSEFYQFATANFDRFSELAKENLDGLTRNFDIWFTKLVSSTLNLISAFRGEQDSGQWHYWNLTDVKENIEINQFPIFGQGGNLILEARQVEMPVLKVEETNDFTETCTDDDIGDVITADHYASTLEEQEVQELEAVQPIILHNMDDDDVANEIDTDEVVIAEVESASSASEIGEVIDHPDIVPEAYEIHTGDFEVNILEAKQAPEKDADVVMNLNAQLVNSEIAEIAEIHTESESEPASEMHTKVHHDDVQLKSEEKSLADRDSDIAEIAEIHTESEQPTSEIHTKVHHDDVQLKSEEKSLAEIAEFAEIHTKVHHDDEQQLKSREKSLADTDSEIAEIHTESEQPPSEIHTKAHHGVQLKPEEKSVVAVIAASILLFLSIIAGAAFKFLKKKDEGRRTTAPDISSMEQPPLIKALYVHHKDEASLEKPSLRNNPTEMDVVIGESYPSEMSSSFVRSSSSYYSQTVVKEENEAQSLEKKPKKNYRRESLASSSDTMGGGSASYGSFTTYEKISSKHGHGGGHGGDRGTVTPVRRSSRIRNLVNSPL